MVQRRLGLKVAPTMAWSDFHCHSAMCDGVGDPALLVEAARARGLEALGFSAHAPLPFACPWCLGRGRDPAALTAYGARVAALSAAAPEGLEIRAGLEVDFIPGLVGPGDPAFASFDYRIGSVHFLGRGLDGRPWAMDDRPDSFARGVEELYGGEIRPLVERYHRALRSMLASSRPDIVGHLDLVKKYNRGGRWFDERAPWYRELNESTLRAVAASGCLLEVNTGGMARGWTEEPYPSPWILERASVLGIPVTLSSDCHRPEDLCFGFEAAAEILLRAGYREAHVLSGPSWAPRPLGAPTAPARRRKTRARGATEAV